MFAFAFAFALDERGERESPTRSTEPCSFSMRCEPTKPVAPAMATTGLGEVVVAVDATLGDDSGCVDEPEAAPASGSDA